MEEIKRLFTIYHIKKQKRAVLTFIQRQNIRSGILSDTACQGLVLDTATSAFSGQAGERKEGHSSPTLSVCE